MPKITLKEAYLKKLNEMARERDEAIHTAEEATRLVHQCVEEKEDLRRERSDPFALLKAFAPDLDMDASGTFNILSLDPEDRNAHYQEIRSVYNSMAFNREVSAMVAELQRFALCDPSTTPEAFKLSRQCLAFIKGMVDRFRQLAVQYDAEVDKKKKRVIVRNTPNG